MKVSLVAVPYNLGQEDFGTAKGPIRVISAGLEATLQRGGFDVEWQQVRRQEPFKDELGAVTTVNRGVAEAVRDAVAAGRFPILISGNCNASLGALSVLDAASTGVVWFDTHGDFNTPETSPSGYLDGMSLAIATGRCYPGEWKAMGGTGGFADAHILLAGVRELDIEEERTLADSEVMLATAGDMMTPGLEQSFLPRIDELRSRVRDVYIHVDVDVIDPEEAPGVDYMSAGGLSIAQLQSIIGWIGERFDLKGAAVACYNPERDRDDRTLHVCGVMATALAGAARASRDAQAPRE
jgi:arginase